MCTVHVRVCVYCIYMVTQFVCSTKIYNNSKKQQILQENLQFQTQKQRYEIVLRKFFAPVFLRSIEHAAGTFLGDEYELELLFMWFLNHC